MTLMVVALMVVALMEVALKVIALVVWSSRAGGLSDRGCRGG